MSTNSRSVASAPRGSGAGAGRVVAIVASVFLLVIGVSLAVGGTAVMAVFGSDGELSSATNTVATPTAAVVTDVAAIRDTSDVAEALGTPIVRVTGSGGNDSGLFVGVGPAGAVDDYLARTEIDQAVDFDVDPFVLELSRRDGAESVAAPPADQDFWVAASAGTADLSWPVRDGDYRVVVMNVDGSAGVDSRLSIGLGLSGVFGVALGTLIFGAVLVFLAIALLVFTRPRRLPPATPGFADRYVLPRNEPVPGVTPSAGENPAVPEPRP